MAHRRSFGGRGSTRISESQRRKKTWSGFTIGGGIINGFQIQIPMLPGAPGSVLSLVSFSAALTTSLAESTLMRLRGSVLISKSIPTTTAGSAVFAFGVAMVTDEAAAIGSVPNPATVLGADWDGWLFYRSTVLDTVETQAGVFDAKAMRKFNSGMSLVFVGGSATDGSATVSGNIDVICRGLFLLA